MCYNLVEARFVKLRHAPLELHFPIHAAGSLQADVCIEGTRQEL